MSDYRPFNAADYHEHRQDADTLCHQVRALDETLENFVGGATVLATVPDEDVDRLVATFRQFCAEMEAADDQSQKACRQMIRHSIRPVRDTV
jgi:hypothetical protein